MTGTTTAETTAAEFAFNRAADALRAMYETAAAASIPLSIEPHLDSVAPTPAAALRLIEQVPGLKITLDWAEFACQNFLLDDAARLFPHVRHIHFRGAARARLQVPLDKNQIDIARILKALTEYGYNGTIAVDLIQLPAGVSRHGAQKVTAIREAAAVRDALRRERDTAGGSSAKAP